MTEDQERTNRYLAGKLGICWHELKEINNDPYHTHLCSCGRKSMFGGGSLHCDRENPNFFTDSGPVILLRALRKQLPEQEWVEYLNIVGGAKITSKNGVDIHIEEFISLQFIITTGALALAAEAWFRAQEGE